MGCMEIFGEKEKGFSAERDLIAAIIERAVLDVWGNPFRATDGTRCSEDAINKLRREAFDWITSDYFAEGSAEWAFQALGLCRKSFVNRLLAGDLKQGKTRMHRVQKIKEKSS
jgi:hypothetical protein